MKKKHIGTRGAWVPPGGGQPKCHVALDLLSLGCSPSATWCFGLGTHRHGPRLALGMVGQDKT